MRNLKNLEMEDEEKSRILKCEKDQKLKKVGLITQHYIHNMIGIT